MEIKLSEDQEQAIEAAARAANATTEQFTLAALCVFTEIGAENRRMVQDLCESSGLGPGEIVDRILAVRRATLDAAGEDVAPPEIGLVGGRTVTSKEIYNFAMNTRRAGLATERAASLQERQERGEVLSKTEHDFLAGREEAAMAFIRQRQLGVALESFEGHED